MYVKLFAAKKRQLFWYKGFLGQNLRPDRQAFVMLILGKGTSEQVSTKNWLNANRNLAVHLI